MEGKESNITQLNSREKIYLPQGLATDYFRRIDSSWKLAKLQLSREVRCRLNLTEPLMVTYSPAQDNIGNVKLTDTSD